MGEFKGKGLVLCGILMRPHRGKQLLAPSVEFCSGREINLFTFVGTQTEPRHGMRESGGKGLVFRGMLIRPHKG